MIPRLTTGKYRCPNPLSALRRETCHIWYNIAGAAVSLADAFRIASVHIFRTAVRMGRMQSVTGEQV